MLTVQAIRVRNLRSLEDTDFIALKPITLLVGKNSSGKSTFARIFPLLRQSVEAVRRTPILWYGRLTDFGTISDARRRDAEPTDGIEFSYRIFFSKTDFSFSLLDFDQRYLFLSNFIDNPNKSRLELDNEKRESMDISIQVGPGSGGETFVKIIKIIIYDNEMAISLNQDGTINSIRVNRSYLDISKCSISFVDLGQLLPQVRLYRSDETKSGLSLSKRNDFLFGQLREYIFNNLVHGNTTYSKIHEIVTQISLDRDSDLLRSLRGIKAPQSWKTKTRTMNVGDVDFISLRDRIFASFIPDILQKANEALIARMKNVRYLEPLRATAQRFYRRQELAVNEIDSRGENMAMFLDSLSWNEKQEFQNWCRNEIGFSVEAFRDGGHVSIRIKPEGEDIATNLADTGFGFSQVLPIAAQIWSSIFRDKKQFANRREADSLLVIEQPELHLHPAFQSRLADLFALACGKQGSDKSRTSIIAETHSSQLVYRLGALVAEGKVSRDDVQVVLFERKMDENSTQVRIAEYDSEGVLVNWPFGFLEADA